MTTAEREAHAELLAAAEEVCDAEEYETGMTGPLQRLRKAIACIRAQGEAQEMSKPTLAERWANEVTGNWQPKDGMESLRDHIQNAIVAAVEAEREACLAECVVEVEYEHQTSCPDGLPGCEVMHIVKGRRPRTPQEIVDAIRARGNP